MDRTTLLGRDHTELGESEVVTVGPVALAITRGRHPKAYPYTEPNEDAVLAAVSDDLVLMAVADGHSGADASHLAIRTIHDQAPRLVGSSPVEAVTAAVEAAGRTLAGTVPPGPTTPATTLTVVAVSDGAGAALGWGDSAAGLLHRKKGRSLLARETVFARLGEPAPRLGEAVSFRPRPGDVLVVATDGLTDFVPAPWADTLGALLGPLSTAEEVVREALDAAGRGGSGDNVAVAAVCMSS